MPVIVDAMGGDHAPAEIVAGCLEAADHFGHEVVLVGDEARLGPAAAGDRVTVVHASQVIGMDEHPAQALRRKKDSSIAVAARLARDTPGSAFLSAGSTGAVLAATLLTWKRIPGVERPCITGFVPTTAGSRCLIADIGANVDCKPSQVAQFAVLCAAYATFLDGVEAPRIGLLNIGEEPAKGDERSQATHALLREAHGDRFVGNLEPHAVWAGEADLVVTDGFAGNIFLKTSETLSNIFHGAVRDRLREAPELAPAATQLLSGLDKLSTDRPEFGGAPLLGVNGTAVITHGSARAATIRDAVDLAARAAASGYLEHLRAAFAPEGGRALA